MNVRFQQIIDGKIQARMMHSTKVSVERDRIRVAPEAPTELVALMANSISAEQSMLLQATWRPELDKDNKPKSWQLQFKGDLEGREVIIEVRPQMDSELSRLQTEVLPPDQSRRFKAEWFGRDGKPVEMVLSLAEQPVQSQGVLEPLLKMSKDDLRVAAAETGVPFDHNASHSTMAQRVAEKKETAKK